MFDLMSVLLIGLCYFLVLHHYKQVDKQVDKQVEQAVDGIRILALRMIHRLVK